MKLIVGLGNIGSKYDNTYHNIGFAAVDAAAEQLGVEFNKTGRNSVYGVKKIIAEAVTSETDENDELQEERGFIIAKPTTFMNLSGRAVQELMQKYKIKPWNVLVVFDDWDLLSGTIKHKLKGSGGTHNGAKDIVQTMGRNDFERIKIGIKPSKDFEALDLAAFVLSKISESEKEKMQLGIKLAAEEIVKFATTYKV